MFMRGCVPRGIASRDRAAVHAPRGIRRTTMNPEPLDFECASRARAEQIGAASASSPSYYTSSISSRPAQISSAAAHPALRHFVASSLGLRARVIRPTLCPLVPLSLRPLGCGQLESRNSTVDSSARKVDLPPWKVDSRPPNQPVFHSCSERLSHRAFYGD